jgi:hypothetical protein
MTLGPIEVLVVAFPGNEFNGRIVPEIASQVERGVISVVDAVLVLKDEAGDLTIIEVADDESDDEHIAAFASLLTGAVEDLVSSEDIDEFAAALDPNSSAMILVFEHTWAKSVRDAIVDSGGVLVRNIRVPGLVVDEVLAAMASLD